METLKSSSGIFIYLFIHMCTHTHTQKREYICGVSLLYFVMLVLVLAATLEPDRWLRLHKASDAPGVGPGTVLQVG